MAFDLEETITAWKVKYGERRISKKYGTEFYAIPIRERKELLRHLVQTFKNKGEDKEFFRQSRVKTAIAATCFPPVVYDKDARKRGYEAVWRELGDIVSEFWVDGDVTEATDFVIGDKAEYNPSIHGRLGKELDKSTLKAPTPISYVDEDASKLLGFTDE